MKRPLCVIGFTVLFTLLALFFADSRVLAVCVFSAAAVLFIVSLIIKRLRQVSVIPTLLLGVAVACLLFSFAERDYAHAVSLCGENLSVSGKVAENPEFSHNNGRYYCIIDLSEISGQKVKGKLRLSFSETYDEISHRDFEIGDKVTFVATVYQTGESNSGIQQYFQSQGVYLGAYGAENFSVSKSYVKGIYYYASLLREKAIDVILSHFTGDTAGFLIAILTGEKSYISDEFYTATKLAGVVHLMAVSGLHLTVWVFFVGAILERKGKKSRGTYFAMMLCVIFMMNFASFTGSVKRAGFMTLLYLFGKIIKQDSDPLNSLGFALTVILMASPYAVFDVGFMLSLFSTLGILVMAYPLSDSMLKSLKTKYDGTLKLKLLTSITESVMVSIAVTVFTLPIMYCYFGYISSVSVLTNLLILFVCMPLVILIGVFVLISSVPILSLVIGLLCKYTALYIIKVVMFMGSLPFAKVNLDFDFMQYWLVFSGVSVFIMVLLRKRKFNFKLALSSVLVVTFAVCCCIESRVNYGSYKIISFSSDETCFLVSCYGRGVIIGVGDDYYFENNVLDEVERTGVTIDAIIPGENADSLTLSYLKETLGAKVIETDCKISLFGVVDIIKVGETVTARGNGKIILLIGGEDLQESENYDIINTALQNGKAIIRKER